MQTYHGSWNGHPLLVERHANGDLVLSGRGYWPDWAPGERFFYQGESYVVKQSDLYWHTELSWVIKALLDSAQPTLKEVFVAALSSAN